MVQFEELLLKLQALKPEIDDLSDALGMKGMLSEIQQLELKATEPGPNRVTRNGYYRCGEPKV